MATVGTGLLVAGAGVGAEAGAGGFTEDGGAEVLEAAVGASVWGAGDGGGLETAAGAEGAFTDGAALG